MMTYHSLFAEMLKSSWTPRGCICPNETYTCQVLLATEIRVLINMSNLVFSLSNDAKGHYMNEGGFEVNLSGVLASPPLGNFSSTLSVIDLSANETKIFCTGLSAPNLAKDNITACVRGILMIVNKPILINLHVVIRLSFATY